MISPWVHGDEPIGQARLPFNFFLTTFFRYMFAIHNNYIILGKWYKYILHLDPSYFNRSPSSGLCPITIIWFLWAPRHRPCRSSALEMFAQQRRAVLTLSNSSMQERCQTLWRDPDGHRPIRVDSNHNSASRVPLAAVCVQGLTC